MTRFMSQPSRAPFEFAYRAASALGRAPPGGKLLARTYCMSIELAPGGSPADVPDRYGGWVLPSVSVRYVRRGKYALQCNNRYCHCKISWRAIFAVIWILTMTAIIGFTAYSAFNDSTPIRKRFANFALRLATIVAPLALQQAAFGNRKPS